MDKTAKKLSEKERFMNLKLKRATAMRFKKFAHGLAPTFSDAMELILDFFERNKISPKEPPGTTVAGLEQLIKKRTNGLVAIIKDIEKNQTLPMLNMMLSLFEKAPKREREREQPRLVERIQGEEEEEKTWEENYIKFLDNHNKRVSKDFSDLRSDFQDFLKRFKETEPFFGKSKFHLSLSKKEYHGLCDKLHVWYEKKKY